jgi:hypothetical protein
MVPQQDQNCGEAMNEAEFTEQMRTMAQQVAQMLADKTPYERSLILHQAQAVWDTLREEKLGVQGARQADEQETFMDATAACMGAILQELPLQSRIEVMQLISQLQQNAIVYCLTQGLDLEPEIQDF